MLGPVPQSEPNDDRSRQISAEEVSGSFVVTCGDTAEVLELIEEALDEVALPVERVIDGGAGPCGRGRSGYGRGHRDFRPNQLWRERRSRHRQSGRAAA